MKLQDIADMRDYLENRCYCPYEIYDMTGFFFQLFKPETNCTLLADGEMGELHGKFVVAKSGKNAEEQIIYIEITDNKVVGCTRIDATENNKKEVLAFMNGEVDKMTIDEYRIGAKKEALEEIMRTADAVMI